MRTIFITFACLIMIFAIAWKLDPGFVESALPELAAYRTTEPKQSAPVQIAVAPTQNKSHSSGIRVPDAAIAPEVVPDPEPEPTIAAPEPVKPPPPPKDPAIASVATDDTTLYSANSSGSKVIRVLKKGQVVEPQFSVSNQGQEWTFVKVIDKKLSGFVLSNDLVEIEKAPADLAVR